MTSSHGGRESLTRRRIGGGKKGNEMKTIKLSGGDLGSETLLVRCNLVEAAAPVEVDYCVGNGWEPTQYQCADTRHSLAGLVAIGKSLAAVAVEMPESEFGCNVEEVEDAAV
jgi:hypothetical protein